MEHRMMRIIYTKKGVLRPLVNLSVHNVHSNFKSETNVFITRFFPRHSTSPFRKKRGTKCSPFTSRRLVDQLLLLHKVCNFDLPVVLVSCTRNRDCTFSGCSNCTSMERISSNTISGLETNLRLESMFSNCTNHL